MPDDLLTYLPESGISWVRRHEGLIGWGESARLTTAGPDRIVHASSWWRSVARHARVDDAVNLPGSGLVAFGSFSFSDASETGGALIVPRYVMGVRSGRAWLTAIADDQAQLAAMLEDLPTAGRQVRPLGDVRLGDAHRSSWSTAVATAVQRIGQGDVDKVVLSRALDVRTDEPLDRRALLRSLAADYPTCWTFHVDGMVGATPELLARVDHGLVTSRVLAGTIRPTGDEQADLAHAAALARSSKDREEHEYAARSVTQVLAGHCASVNVPEEPSVLHLPNVMHLATDVTGVLNHHATALELVADLHPSAAVCGTPTLAAAGLIDELEVHDRGRYAGPVGWINADGDGEWCIALRSAQLDGDDDRLIRLYAGCGIVAASRPDAEWAESEAKLEPMLRALGVDDGKAAWEERYRSTDTVWSKDPNPTLVQHTGGLAPGRAWDFGCGEGADAVWLAKQGWSVTAVDLSQTALQRASEHAERERVADRIAWSVADASTAVTDEAGFALVTSHFAHPERGSRWLVDTLMPGVAPGGTLLVVGHHPSDDRASSNPSLHRRAFDVEDVLDLFDPAQWTVQHHLAHNEAVLHDGTTQTRRDAVLIATRVG